MKRNKILAGLIGAALIAYVVGTYVAQQQTGPDLAGLSRPAETTGRFLIYNEKEPFGAAVSAKTFQALGAEQVPGLNAFVTDRDPSGLRAMQALPDGWKIQPEYVHHVLSGATPVAAKCYQSNGPLVEVACGGTPTPNPTPTPEPTPIPTPPDCKATSWGVSRTHACEAQAAVDTSSVKVCIVDTGIDLNHPNNGVISASIGYAGPVQDGAGHGTHTAGTVAGRGGVGVSKAKLFICKGLSDSGSGSSAQLAQCLSWCASQGAQIVSNSWGSTQSDGMINSAINALTQRGTYVFVAAGNDSGPVNWPARLAGSNPLVYAVAASDSTDRITGFSSRGPEVRAIAPGASIISNWPGGGTRPLDGTSMATPHAAAICAFGVARGIRPCVRFSGKVSGYDFPDALATATGQ